MPNAIAVFGFGSWAAQPIVPALVAAGARVRVLPRKGAVSCAIPEGVESVEVDWADETNVLNALKGIDIVISLVGHYGIDSQYLLIPALKEAGVKLFVPSELSFPVSPKDNETIDPQRFKAELEVKLVEAGVPFVRVYIGDFAEFALDTPVIGVDVPNNRIVYTGHSDTQGVNLVTRPYVAAAYASLFANAPPSEVAGRSLLLTELRPTGAEIAMALEAKHGVAPAIARTPLAAMAPLISSGSPVALSALVRRMWAEGVHGRWEGVEAYDIPGARKRNIYDLIVEGELDNYRPVPFDKATFLDREFA
ncbi:hypothetical protein JCM24511_04041 [Saitozyma sp. JCM 24511]|nr:hypothetical protein JCM24511_04041 [Saitozyma sp. JCM 24511]